MTDTVAIRDVVATTEFDPYLTLRGLSTYCGLSVTTLKRFLQNERDPLPHYRPGGGKVLVRRSEFDQWISRYKNAEPTDSGRDVSGIVNAAMAKFGGA